MWTSHEIQLPTSELPKREINYPVKIVKFDYLTDVFSTMIDEMTELCHGLGTK